MEQKNKNKNKRSISKLRRVVERIRTSAVSLLSLWCCVVRLRDRVRLKCHDLLVEQLLQLFPADVIFVYYEEISGLKGNGDWVCKTDNQIRKTRGRAVERRARRQGRAKGRLVAGSWVEQQENNARTYASRYG